MEELDEELRQLMKEQAPAGEVQLKFDELCRENQRSCYALYLCYLVHYGYQYMKIDRKLLLEASRFNPFLTAAHERKQWFFHQTQFNSLHLHDNITTFCKAFAPAYGIFEDDDIHTNYMTSIPDIIFPRDDVSYFAHLLPSGKHAEGVLLVRAARHGAKQCCQMLLSQTEIHSDSGTVDPCKWFSLLIDDVLRICDITVENSLCTFQMFIRKFPQHHSPFRLDQNIMESMKKLDEDINIIKNFFRTYPLCNFSVIRNALQSSSLGCDFGLFSRMSLLSLDTLLKAQAAQTSEPFVVSDKGDYYHVAKLAHECYGRSRYIVNLDYRFLCAQHLNNVIKLMLTFGMKPPWLRGYFNLLCVAFAMNKQTALSESMAGLFRILTAYGIFGMDLKDVWWRLKPRKIITKYHTVMIETIQECISVLPREVHERCRFRVLAKVSLMEQRQGTGTEAARYQKMFAICRKLWRRECQSLSDLCRHKIYQILPRGKVPIYAQQFEIPEILKSYLSLWTDNV